MYNNYTVHIEVGPVLSRFIVVNQTLSSICLNHHRLEHSVNANNMTRGQHSMAHWLQKESRADRAERIMLQDFVSVPDHSIYSCTPTIKEISPSLLFHASHLYYCSPLTPYSSCWSTVFLPLHMCKMSFYLEIVYRHQAVLGTLKCALEHALR